MVRLALASGGVHTYVGVLTNPRYVESLVSTVLLSAAVTLTTLVLAGIAGVFLVRNRFFGRDVLVSMLTLPLAFPGVVVGFFVIALAGRTGFLAAISTAFGGPRIVFAYSLAGLFVGYLYFSIPRVLLTVMAGAQTLDPALEEAARTLGAGRVRVVRDVIVPGLAPALIASGAICFSTAMGAFGTAFTLATELDVLPMTIYTAFTAEGDVAVAAALSIVLGAITWATLALARIGAKPGAMAAA